MRALLGTCLFAVLVCPVPAQAARCTPLLTDPVGDARPFAPSPVDDLRQVDLVAADLRSDARALHATLRVDRLDPESAPLASHSYAVAFASNGQSWVLNASVGPTGTFFSAGWGGPATSGGGASASSYVGLGPVDGRVVAATGRIEWTAALEVFAPRGGLRSRLQDVIAETGSGTSAVTPVYGTGTSQQVDTGTGSRSYPLGRPGCL